MTALVIHFLRVRLLEGINPFRAAIKRELTIVEIYYLQQDFLKTFEGKIVIRNQTTTLLQICELYVTFKSMRVADDTLSVNGLK